MPAPVVRLPSVLLVPVEDQHPPSLTLMHLGWALSFSLRRWSVRMRSGSTLSMVWQLFASDWSSPD